MLIALFVFVGAGFELHTYEVREALAHLRVRDSDGHTCANHRHQ